MDLYGLFGNPIQHSLSPRIHRLFSEQTSHLLQYKAACVQIDNFHPAVTHFIDQGGKGLNITSPFKCVAFEFANSVSARAKRAKAVNTLSFDEKGNSYGDNTDGAGLVRDLYRLQFPIKNARILLLGAGGAARGVLNNLLNEDPQHIVISNRTEVKAAILAAEFADLGSVVALGLKKLSGIKFDLVINATSVSMQNEMMSLPKGIWAKDAYAYDMSYGPRPTSFLSWAQSHGAKTSDGLGMLVEQAAESFFIWRNVRPNVANVLDFLYQLRVKEELFQTISQIKEMNP